MSTKKDDFYAGFDPLTIKVDFKAYTYADMEQMRQDTLEAAAQRIEEQYKIISASGFNSLSLRNTTIQYAKVIRSLKFTK